MCDSYWAHEEQDRVHAWVMETVSTESRTGLDQVIWEGVTGTWWTAESRTWRSDMCQHQLVMPIARNARGFTNFFLKNQGWMVWWFSP